MGVAKQREALVKCLVTLVAKKSLDALMGVPKRGGINCLDAWRLSLSEGYPSFSFFPPIKHDGAIWWLTVFNWMKLNEIELKWLTCMICCCRACSRYMEGTLPPEPSSGRREATSELLHGDAEFISNNKATKATKNH